MSNILRDEDLVFGFHTKDGAVHVFNHVSEALAITVLAINLSGNWPPHVLAAPLQALLRNGEPC